MLRRFLLHSTKERANWPVKDTPTVWYHTFGCKANQYDTERMRQELEGRGAQTVSDSADADVAVINTCTVTNQADANARHLVRRLRRRHPGIRIVTAGCSTSFREADYQTMGEVDAVVPGHDPNLVAAELMPLGLGSGLDGGPQPLYRNARGTRAWLKVQDGCDRKCSFCATRIARGSSVSRSPKDVVKEAKILARSHPELVITGIHIGHYGHDLQSQTTLAELCEQILEAVPVRVRLSSIEATEIDDRLLDLLACSGGQLAPHLHVPLQSGSDAVLRLMRRWHSREAYRTRILEIAESIGPFGLGADVFVGFPGEGDAEFEETKSLVEELPYTYLHVFPYSVRDGTVAASLPNPVLGGVIATRSRELRGIGVEKGRVYEKSRVGSIADFVVEGTHERRVGVTGDYLRADLHGKADLGDRFSARLKERDGCLMAEAPDIATTP